MFKESFFHTKFSLETIFMSPRQLNDPNDALKLEETWKIGKGI